MEKFRSLIRFGAEFSPQRLALHAEGDSPPPGSSTDVQRLSAQMDKTRTELAQAVDSMLTKSERIDEQLRVHIAASIEDYFERANKQALSAIQILVERLIFEYVLRGPALWSAVVSHVTYVLTARSDIVAQQNAGDYIGGIADAMIRRGSIGLTKVADQWVLYMVQQQPQPPGGQQSLFQEGSSGAETG